MIKKQFKIKSYINPDIKIGDTVRLIDGSGLTHSTNIEDVYIIGRYPHLVNSNLPLSEMRFKVVNTGITDLVCEGVCDLVYLQDIKIEYEGSVFFTCSRCVIKL